MSNFYSICIARQGRQAAPGVHSREHCGTIAFKIPCDPLVERGLRLSGRPQSHRLCHAVAMRVQAPPSWCRSDSISPRPATGLQRSEAGRNGGPWKPRSGYPVSQASMGSASEGVSSHRQNDPAQEADALEPTGTGYGAGSRQSDRYARPRNPVESTALRMRTMGTGNGGT
jgi:hypothetical protein